jgi:hypothetical protein
MIDILIGFCQQSEDSLPARPWSTLLVMVDTNAIRILLARLFGIGHIIERGPLS